MIQVPKDMSSSSSSFVLSKRDDTQMKMTTTTTSDSNEIVVVVTPPPTTTATTATAATTTNDKPLSTVIGEYIFLAYIGVSTLAGFKGAWEFVLKNKMKKNATQSSPKK
jgi:hypothetical protein